MQLTSRPRLAPVPVVGAAAAAVLALSLLVAPPVLASTDVVPSPSTDGAVGADAAWQVTDYPSRYGGLQGVATSGDAAVAVGFRIDKQFRFSALTAVWDGDGWTRQPVRGRLGESRLDDVTLTSPTRGWAVGHSDGVAAAYVARWDGTRWRSHPLYEVDGDLALLGVATAGSDVWAVGQDQVGDTLEPVVVHKTSDGWVRDDLPELSDVGPVTALSGVSTESRDSVWAVGLGGLTLHFDGTRWRQVALPKIDGRRADLQQVRSFGADDTWAVGYVYASGARRPVAYHWTGTRWEVVATPTSDAAQLNDVVRTAGGAVQAVGYDVSGAQQFYGLRLSLDGPATPLALPPGDDALFAAAVGDDGLWVVGSGGVEKPGYIAPYAALRR